MSPNAALAWLRRRWWLVLVVAIFLAAMAWLAFSAIEDSDYRQQRSVEAAAQRDRIEGLAAAVAAQQADIQRSLAILQAATSPEAQARSAATLARAIADLRRSIDCAALYASGARPPACVDPDGRMDRLLAGEDPFDVPAPIPATTTPGGPQ